MTMAHQLACLPAGVSETEAIDYIIKSHLQDLKQVLPGDSKAPLRFSEMPAELPLQHSIGVSCLLLLP
jgi:hypothetical protein